MKTETEIGKRLYKLKQRYKHKHVQAKTGRAHRNCRHNYEHNPSARLEYGPRRPPEDGRFACCEGSTLTLDGTGTTGNCSGNFLYQWTRNDLDIPGATGSTYTTDPALPAGAYNYGLKVSCDTYPLCTGTLDPPLSTLVLTRLVPNANLIGPNPACEGDVITVDASTTQGVCISHRRMNA